jgi:hypothetical protein
MLVVPVQAGTMALRDDAVGMTSNDLYAEFAPLP